MIFAITLYASALLAGMQDQPELEVLAAIRTAYQANRAAITRATIRLTFSIGDAPNMASALSGRWTDRTDADCLFVLDGDRARYEQLFNPEDLRVKRTMTGPLNYTTRLRWVRALTDGRATLSDQMFSSGADAGVMKRRVRIDPGTDPFYAHALLPLYLGRPGANTPFGRLPKVLRDGTSGLRLTGVKLDSRLDGIPVAEITLKAEDTTICYWVDLRRGAVPILERCETNGGKIVILDRYEDIRKVANGTWLPFRHIQFSTNGNSVHEWIIREADFDKVPDAGQFRLKLPKAQAVVDMAAMLDYPPSDVWDLARLPAANAPGVQSIRPRGASVEAPVMPGERRPTPYAAITSVVAGVILVTLALILYRRRSRA